jgi:hypothetical protein
MRFFAIKAGHSNMFESSDFNLTTKFDLIEKYNF